MDSQGDNIQIASYVGRGREYVMFFNLLFTRLQMIGHQSQHQFSRMNIQNVARRNVR